MSLMYSFGLYLLGNGPFDHLLIFLLYFYRFSISFTHHNYYQPSSQKNRVPLLLALCILTFEGNTFYRKYIFWFKGVLFYLFFNLYPILMFELGNIILICYQTSLKENINIYHFINFSLLCLFSFFCCSYCVRCLLFCHCHGTVPVSLWCHLGITAGMTQALLCVSWFALHSEDFCASINL